MKIYTIEYEDDPYCPSYLAGVFWSLPDALKALEKSDKSDQPTLTEWTSLPNGKFVQKRYTEDGKKWVELRDN